MTTNARRLVADFVRRSWYAYATSAVFIVVLSVVTSTARTRAGFIWTTRGEFFAWLLAGSWFLTFVPFMMLEQRELVRFPISRRDFWLAKWWLGVAVAPIAVCIAAATAAAWVFGGPLPADVTALALLLTTTYCGALLTANVWWPHRPREGSGPAAVTHILLTIVCRWLMWLFAPFAMAPYLPTGFADITPSWTLILLAFVAITAAGYFHAPAITARPGRPDVNARRPETAKRRASNRAGGLTGLAQLAYAHGREVFFTMPFLVFVMFAIEWFGGTQYRVLRDRFHAAQLMPFDRDWVFDGPHGINFIMLVFVGFGHKAGELLRRMRALRVLPLSALQLSLAMAMMPLITTVVFWTWLVVIHVWVTGTWPTTLRPDLFALLSGGLVLAQAIERVGGRVLAVAVVVPFAVAGYGFFSWITIPGVLTGVSAFAAGVVLFTRIIRRRSRLYKFKPSAFMGMSTPQ